MCERLPLRFFAQRKRHLDIKIKDSTLLAWALMELPNDFFLKKICKIQSYQNGKFNFEFFCAEILLRYVIFAFHS